MCSVCCGKKCLQTGLIWNLSFSQFYVYTRGMNAHMKQFKAEMEPSTPQIKQIMFSLEIKNHASKAGVLHIIKNFDFPYTILDQL